jgi:hypothetical protein
MIREFEKAYLSDYEKFKERAKDAGFNIMEARVMWQNLLGSDKYQKKDALKKLKDSGVKLQGLSTLRMLL